METRAVSRRGNNRQARLTADQRAERLVAKWDRSDPTFGDRSMDLEPGIANEIEAAEEDTHRHLRTRITTITAQLECSIAAIKELRLKQAVRQSVANDWYRNVAGRGVRLGLAALRTYKQDVSEQIRHETRAKNRPHVESETRNHLDRKKPGA